MRLCEFYKYVKYKEAKESDEKYMLEIIQIKIIR